MGWKTSTQANTDRSRETFEEVQTVGIIVFGTFVRVRAPRRLRRLTIRSCILFTRRNSVRVQGRKLVEVPFAPSSAVYEFAHSMWDCREPQKARTNQSGCWLRRGTC